MSPRALRVLASLTVTLTAPACQQPAAPGDQAIQPALAGVKTPVTTVGRDPFTLDLENPCTGEPVHIEGQTLVAGTALFQDGLVIQSEFHLTTAGSGSGYQFRDVSTFIFSSPSVEATHGTISFPETVKLVSQGAGQNFSVRFGFHITITPDGTAKTTVDVIQTECRG